MRTEIIDQLRDAHDLQSLTRGVLALCEPYGAVHSFKLVHNRGAARVVCFVELESPKQQPALARALGAKTINGAACLDIPVSEDFGGDRMPGMPGPLLGDDSALARVTN
jgi:hypothetical protein